MGRIVGMVRRLLQKVLIIVLAVCMSAAILGVTVVDGCFSSLVAIGSCCRVVLVRLGMMKMVLVLLVVVVVVSEKGLVFDAIQAV